MSKEELVQSLNRIASGDKNNWKYIDVVVHNTLVAIRNHDQRYLDACGINIKELAKALLMWISQNKRKGYYDGDSRVFIDSVQRYVIAARNLEAISVLAEMSVLEAWTTMQNNKPLYEGKYTLETILEMYDFFDMLGFLVVTTICETGNQSLAQEYEAMYPRGIVQAYYTPEYVYAMIRKDE